MRNSVATVARVVVAAALSCVVPAFADTLTWTGGGDGVTWNDSANWSLSGDHLIPQTGDSVIIDIGETATTVSNNIENLSLKKFTARGQNDIALTIAGNPIGLAGVSSVNTIIWTNCCSIVLNADISLSGGNGTMFFGGKSTVVNGDISVPSGKSLKFKGRPRKASSGSEFGQSGLISDTVTITFNGDVGGEGSTLYFAMGANKNGTTAYHYGNVICKNFYLASDTCPQSSHLCKPGNKIEAIRLFATNGCYLDVADALDESTVINFNATSHYVWDTSCLRFLAGSHQTLNRLAGGDPKTSSKLRRQCIFAGEDGSFQKPSSDTCTLELKGSTNAVSYVILNDAVNVIWNPTNDYTQDFRDCRHFTSGSIEVRRGTVRTSGTNSFLRLTKLDVAAGAAVDVSSTNSVAFPALEWLLMEDGARFYVTNSSITALGGTSLARLATSAKFVLANDVSLELTALQFGGAFVSPGTYSAANCTWIEGDGSVTIGDGSTGGRISFWKAPVSGSWNDAENWIGGVPDASTEAYISVYGADYTVTVDSAITMPKSLAIYPKEGTATVDVSVPLTDPGMTLDVSTNGVLRFAPGGSFTSTSKSSSITIRDGGRLFVDGGEFSIKKFAGKFNVSGTGSSTGRISVVSGSFSHATTSADSRLFVRQGGLLEASGGNLTFPYDTRNPLSMCGGRLAISGSARFSQSGTSTPYANLATGEMVFGGSSTYYIEATTTGYFSVTPNYAGETAYVKFMDQAVFTNYCKTIRVGGTSMATGRLDFASSVWHGRHNLSSNWDASNQGYVGYNAGYGEMNVMNGLIHFGARGFMVAGNYSSGNVPSGEVRGRVNVSGGCLYVHGSEGDGWDSGLHALTVGDGSFCKNTIDGRPFVGEMYITGGSVTNYQCNLIVGAGYARGHFEMTDGIMRIRLSSRELMVGFCGGIGVCNVKGGTLSGAGNAYIGGSFTNLFDHGYMLADTCSCIDRHDAEGTLRVSGGEVTFGGTCYVGADGAGTVEMLGRDGSLSFGGLVTSNTAATATSSTLKFTLGAEGVSPISVSGATTLTDGTKIVVDYTEYSASRSVVKLIDCSNISADLDALDVEYSGIRPGQAIMKRLPDGLYSCLIKGTVIYMK